MTINLAHYTVRITPDWTVFRRQVATEAAALRATLGAPVAIRVTFPTAASVGAQIGREAAREFARAFRATLAALPTPPAPGPTVRQSTTSGATSGGAYARAFRAATDEAIRNLPAARVTLIRLPQVDREIAALQRDLGHLNNQRIGIDIDAATALAEVDRIQRELTRLGSTHTNVQVRADTAAAALRLSALRAQLAALGQVGGPAGRQFTSGFMQQLSGLPSLMSPIGIALATAVVVSAAPLIAAGIVAAILLAVGGGVLAAGIAAAAQDPRIQAAFGALGAKAKQIFITMGEDFKEPLLRAVGTFATSLDRIAPTLRAMSAAAAPLVDKLAPALAMLVENVMPGLLKALQAAVPLFEVIADKAPALGTAISKFFAAIADGGPGANQLLKDLFDFLIFIIPKVGEGLAWLGNAWRFFRGFVIIAITEVQVAWGFFRTSFEAVRIALGFLIDALQLQFRNMATAVSAAVTVIRNVWNAGWAFLRDNVFGPLANIITNTIPNAFQRGVDMIGGAWDRLRAFTRAPVEFFVNTVVNRGVIDTFNAVAKLIPGIPTIAHVPGFAEGGPIRGPGGPRDDVIPAWLSNGEYVIPANVVRDLGVPFFNRLIGKPSSPKPGDGSNGIAFADGGLVGLLANAAGWVKDRINLDAIPGGGQMKKVLVGAGGKMVTALIDWAKDKVSSLFGSTTQWLGPISSDAAGILSWLRAQNGKPYIWASAGPAGYDCSGIVSAVWNLMHGANPYRHTFSTSGQGLFFPKRNQVGILTAGWANPGERGGGSVGHTAGTFAGVGFESTGSRGVRVGAGTTPVTNFAHWGTFADGGLVAKVFDSGGIWRPGELGVNTGSRNELVVPEGMKISLSDDTIARLGDRIALGVGRVLNGASMTALHIGRARA